MTQQLIIFPMITLVLLTGSVGIAMLIARYRAVREKTLGIAYFKYNRGGKPPEYLLKITQHFDNLLEIPFLFYLSILVILILQKVDIWYLSLAWLYITSRFIHAWIHMGSNHIIRRKNAFLIGYVLIFTIWVRLLIQLVID
ncbi:MAG: MAPEG family protein [Candidatus Thiodiazotropha sp.]|nr:MAPEG family protein [Candidatus Thiodiazotropha sp.]MCM8884040.1 MAPEG family protein [Candidatus Thiodiazotropha sp.]MCM8919701.1 MAPEG family protein [Candidatus Thiodiazotropha sp.]